MKGKYELLRKSGEMWRSMGSGGMNNKRLIFGHNTCAKLKRKRQQVTLVGKDSSVYLRYRVYGYWMCDREKARDEVGEKDKALWYKAP